MTFIENDVFDKNVCGNLNVKYLFLLYFLVVLFINVFPYCVKDAYILHSPWIHVFNHPFDCWALSHFLFYILLGFLFPHYWKLVLIIGVVWEVMEYIGYHIEKHVLKNEKIYWCAKFSDIIVNVFGFIVGLLLRFLVAYFFLHS
jgi:hypothetical protein